ncbi:hypothetical protein ON010_g2513 [Phytophthora cinnamomi]|nr:hypothetical protein ON010_g2513 [Phytophthora cinnamomi]
MAEAAQLDAFLAAMTQYSPTVPEELVEFYLQQAGFVTNDVRHAADLPGGAQAPAGRDPRRDAVPAHPSSGHVDYVINGRAGRRRRLSRSQSLRPNDGGPGRQPQGIRHQYLQARIRERRCGGPRGLKTRRDTPTLVLKKTDVL